MRKGLDNTKIKIKKININPLQKREITIPKLHSAEKCTHLASCYHGKYMYS